MTDDASASPQPRTFNNQYWLLRHGRSLANEAGLIVSEPANGHDYKWGLAAAGKAQATAAGKLLAEQLTEQGALGRLMIVSSPFSRTIQTAHRAAVEADYVPACVLPRFELQERFFGSENELQPYEGRYEATWARDAEDLDHRPGGNGESVNMVVKRLSMLFEDLEATFTNQNILLVSHGDTLSICQAAFSPVPKDLHYHYRDCAFQTAELKRLN